jgi:histidinol phosphatase-like PHP family hydrolase
MFDLHTHSIFSDGELIPSELVRRAVCNGYEAVAITDHVDFTNVAHVLKCLRKLEVHDKPNCPIEVLTGVEITHVPPEKIGKLASKAKDLGAELVVVHGETIAEPVEFGTNKAAVSIPVVNILAHPGLITEEEPIGKGIRSQMGMLRRWHVTWERTYCSIQICILRMIF